MPGAPGDRSELDVQRNHTRSAPGDPQDVRRQDSGRVHRSRRSGERPRGEGLTIGMQQSDIN